MIKEKRLSINISEELHQELKVKAAQNKISLKALISKIIDKYKKEV
jgi:predicted HicB family RNase H-like nuclease